MDGGSSERRSVFDSKKSKFKFIHLVSLVKVREKEKGMQGKQRNGEIVGFLLNKRKLFSTQGKTIYYSRKPIITIIQQYKGKWQNSFLKECLIPQPKIKQWPSKINLVYKHKLKIHILGENIITSNNHLS